MSVFASASASGQKVGFPMKVGVARTQHASGLMNKRLSQDVWQCSPSPLIAVCMYGLVRSAYYT